MELTTHQNDIIHKTKTELRKNNIVVLKGSAGVGKTTCVPYIIPTNSIVTAPTHKAVAVLEEKTNAKFNTKTIHSHLKLRLGYDYKGGYNLIKEENYKPPKNTTIVVDEGSMISSQLLPYIQDDIIENQNTYLILGDEKQLNPVGELESPIFLEDYSTLELTEIIRQAAENDNIYLSRNLDELKTKKDGSHYKWIKKQDTIKHIIEGAKFICWTNRAVAKLNTLTRETLFDNPRQFEIGETILLKKQYEEYKNNEEVEIHTLDEYTYTTTLDGDKVEIKYWDINSSIQVVHADCIKVYNKIKNNLLQKAKKYRTWRDYYEFIETFAEVQHTYAITTHKAQGSTYDNCVLYISEMFKNTNKKERDRLLYTAITRTSNLNYLL